MTIKMDWMEEGRDPWTGYLSKEEGEKLYGERIEYLFRLNTALESKVKVLACCFVIVSAAYLSLCLVLLLRG